jgi:hypothetical protein
VRHAIGFVARHLDDIRMSIFRHCLGEELIALEPYVVQDLFAIIHGMVEAAGQKGEFDGEGLARRVDRAVSGYIGVIPDRKHAPEQPNLWDKT